MYTRKMNIFGAVLAMCSIWSGAAILAADAELPFSVKSQEALAFLQFDFENNPGRMLTIKGGYQWNFFRNVGYTIEGAGHRHSRDYIRHKPAASVAVGYNFGDQMPVTIGLQVGMGGGANINTYSSYTFGGSDYLVSGRQKFRSYLLDLSLDYEIKNSSRLTPYVGVIGGAAMLGNRGKITITDAATGALVDRGSYGKRTRFNLAGGAQVGAKFEFNDRTTFSLTGSYVYAGRVPGEAYHHMTTVSARTNKVRVHELAVKAGVKIMF